MSALFNAVYDTPCGGKITALLRLGEGGVIEMNVNRNVAGGGLLNPNVPEDRWLPMDATFGLFENADEMAAAVNAREGWSVTPA